MNLTSIKTIHSRSNKEIGDVIETEWEITGKKVIAEPRPADGRQAAQSQLASPASVAPGGKHHRFPSRCGEPPEHPKGRCKDLEEAGRQFLAVIRCEPIPEQAGGFYAALKAARR